MLHALNYYNRLDAKRYRNQISTIVRHFYVRHPLRCCREETVLGTPKDSLVSAEKSTQVKSYSSVTLTTSFPLTRPVFNFS